MTVQSEQNMKREDQQDATIRGLLLTSISTCFRHYYTHLQEKKNPYRNLCIVLQQAGKHNYKPDVFFCGVVCSKPSWDFVCICECCVEMMPETSCERS